MCPKNGDEKGIGIVRLTNTEVLEMTEIVRLKLQEIVKKETPSKR